MSFSMYELIDLKKNGHKLSTDSIKWIITQYTAGKIPDYQMSAMLMCIFLKGMDERETADLTNAMLYSGKVLNFSTKNVVDKHSTGGIGDKTSFILAPIAAAAGVKVPMIAGRGLGFTGGTVDKIEAITGFNTKMNLDDFKKMVEKEGIVLIGQTPEIAPADKMIYALRDVTATIESIPLITASIMSKKLAEGANGMVLDIKYGTGAFMREKKQAKLLANSLIKTAKRFDKKVVALITDMNQPLGKMVGHSLELVECFEILKGNGDQRLIDLSLELAAYMVLVGGVEKNIEAARKKVNTVWRDGSAFKCLERMIKLQGGDTSCLHDYSKLPHCSEKTIIKAERNGYVKNFKNSEIGMQLLELGGGRKTKDDKIDFAVGFEFNVQIGDKVKKGETLLTVYHHKNQSNTVSKMHAKFNKEIIEFSATRVKPIKLIEAVMK
jgi:pyrimidine-nucleoside phosphorylase